MKSGLRIGAILVPMLWAGMLIGVSFLATPVKFSAPSLDLAAAIDVGRVTFGLFNKVEGGLAVLFLLVSLFLGGSKLRLAVALVLGGLVLSQTFWLLPALNVRSAALIAGQPLPSSIHHGVYGAVEIAKLSLLLLTAIFDARKLHFSQD